MCATNCFAATQPSINFFSTLHLSTSARVPLPNTMFFFVFGLKSVPFRFCLTSLFMQNRVHGFFITQIRSFYYWAFRWHIQDRVQNSCAFWGNDTHCKEPNWKFETNIPRIERPQFQFPHSCDCERFIGTATKRRSTQRLCHKTWLLLNIAAHNVAVTKCNSYKT